MRTFIILQSLAMLFGAVGAIPISSHIRRDNEPVTSVTTTISPSSTISATSSAATASQTSSQRLNHYTTLDAVMTTLIVLPPVAALGVPLTTWVYNKIKDLYMDPMSAVDEGYASGLQAINSYYNGPINSEGMTLQELLWLEEERQTAIDAFEKMFAGAYYLPARVARMRKLAITGDVNLANEFWDRTIAHLRETRKLPDVEGIVKVWEQARAREIAEIQARLSGKPLDSHVQEESRNNGAQHDQHQQAMEESEHPQSVKNTAVEDHLNDHEDPSPDTSGYSSDTDSSAGHSDLDFEDGHWSNPDSPKVEGSQASEKSATEDFWDFAGAESNSLLPYDGAETLISEADAEAFRISKANLEELMAHMRPTDDLASFGREFLNMRLGVP